MSTVPPKYQPTQRTIDDSQRLRELYVERGLPLREIADEYTEVSHSMVAQKLDEYGIERPNAQTPTTGFDDFKKSSQSRFHETDEVEADWSQFA